MQWIELPDFPAYEYNPESGKIRNQKTLKQVKVHKTGDHMYVSLFRDGKTHSRGYWKLVGDSVDLSNMDQNGIYWGDMTENDKNMPEYDIK